MIINKLEDMITKLTNVQNSLEEKIIKIGNQKADIDSLINTSQADLNELESRNSIIERIDDSYKWYKYYFNKCEEEGEDADSGL